MIGAETVVVVARGQAPAVARARCRRSAVIAADGGRRPALALGLEVDLRRRLRLGLRRPGSPRPRRRARGSSAIPPRRTPPTSSSRSTPRSRSEPARDPRDRSARRPARPPARRRSCCSAPSATPALEVDALLGDAVLAVIRGERDAAGEPGRARLPAAARGRGRGRDDDGLEYPLAGETLDAGTSRGVSNVFRPARPASPSSAACLLAVRPGAAREEPAVKHQTPLTASLVALAAAAVVRDCREPAAAAARSRRTSCS